MMGITEATITASLSSSEDSQNTDITFQINRKGQLFDPFGLYDKILKKLFDPFVAKIEEQNKIARGGEVRSPQTAIEIRNVKTHRNAKFAIGLINVSVF